jgi:hypothetical protein
MMIYKKRHERGGVEMSNEGEKLFTLFFKKNLWEKIINFHEDYKKKLYEERGEDPALSSTIRYLIIRGIDEENSTKGDG